MLEWFYPFLFNYSVNIGESLCSRGKIFSKISVTQFFSIFTIEFVLCTINNHSRCWFPLTGINKEPCVNHGLSRNCNPVLIHWSGALFINAIIPPNWVEKADKVRRVRRLAFNVLTLLSRNEVPSGIESPLRSHLVSLSVFLFYPCQNFRERKRLAV